jgi:hypothetical protein
MGLFDKLKGIFAGTGGGKQPADSGIYLYVKLARSGEIVRLRLEPQYELVPDYDAGGFVCHKTVVGPHSFQRAEAAFHFDAGRRLTGWDISGGELVDQAAWEAQEDTTRAQPPDRG